MRQVMNTPSLSVDAVLELARLTGLPVDDADMAERIAAGAAAAAHAVRVMVDSTVMPDGQFFGLESADYLSLLESLTPAARAQATIRDAAAGRASEGDPSTLELCEVAARLATRELRAIDVLRSALAAAERANQRTNCFLSIEPRAALAAAELADALLDDAAGAGRQPAARLLGIPLAHKDMFERQGFAATCGSRVSAGQVALRNATVIERMGLEGAVTIGSLHMAEFALGPTGHNAAFGDCRNAWDPAYIAGGSSSGSAAAVACGAAFGSLGSDTGGSVRIPAAAQGVFGLKPTYGLVPRTGSMKLTPSIDVIGPMARSTRDLAWLLQVIAGGDGRDAQCSMRPLPDYNAALGRGVEGMRVGVPRNHFLVGVDPPIRAAWERTLATFESAGAQVVEVEIPGAESMAELSRAIVYSEATALHAQWLRSRGRGYTPQVRVRATTGLAIPGTLYLEALQLRLSLLEHVVRGVFGRCDVLLTPTVPLRLPRRDETDVGAGPELWRILERLVQCTAPVNYLGLPALSMPAGMDDRGLPIGMQLVAAPFAESTLLQAAAVHERIRPFAPYCQFSRGQQKA